MSYVFLHPLIWFLLKFKNLIVKTGKVSRTVARSSSTVQTFAPVEMSLNVYLHPLIFFLLKFNSVIVNLGKASRTVARSSSTVITAFPAAPRLPPRTWWKRRESTSLRPWRKWSLPDLVSVQTKDSRRNLNFLPRWTTKWIRIVRN